jgi:hypothetical protein
MATCLMLDDTLDVLPWARQTLTIAPVPPKSQVSNHATIQFLFQDSSRSTNE